MLDCLWGLLDRVNDAGLAISLAFGGRPQVGEGFGIPLVIRYVQETCGSTEVSLGEIRTDGNRDHTDTTRVFPTHEQG
jgi:predicted choloylglycine hydrolase